MNILEKRLEQLKKSFRQKWFILRLMSWGKNENEDADPVQDNHGLGLDEYQVADVDEIVM